MKLFNDYACQAVAVTQTALRKIDDAPRNAFGPLACARRDSERITGKVERIGKLSDGCRRERLPGKKRHDGAL